MNKLADVLEQQGIMVNGQKNHLRHIDVKLRTMEGEIAPELNARHHALILLHNIVAKKTGHVLYSPPQVSQVIQQQPLEGGRSLNPDALPWAPSC